MALTRTKISKLLITPTFSKMQCFAFAFARGSGNCFQVDPFRDFGSSSLFSSTSAATAVVPEENGWTVFGLVREYEDYRRNLYGGLTHKALLVDAVGTLVVPSQPMAQVLCFFTHTIFYLDYVVSFYSNYKQLRECTIRNDLTKLSFKN
ncbi:putative hydrolase (HAD superfamily) [Abeliophyllum distichum]|uniref:Hydrolase (HAD superfamily) n=1 Tax=Abeliophyllum distichum TaxID=126358 RepID=A0ABD1VVF9_9LAMI